MTVDPEKILASHALYVKLTGFGDISLNYGRERIWYEWLKRFTDQDLRLLITYLQSEIRKQRRNPGCLKFNNLIGQPDMAEEDLALAKASTRNAVKPPTPRQSILAATGRVEAKEQPSERPVGQIAVDLTGDYEALRRAAGL